MALSTKAGLKAAVATWLERTGDGVVTASIDDIITLAEARLNQDLAGIRTTMPSATLTGTIGSRALTLPTGFLSPLSLMLTTYGDERKLRPYVVGEEELLTANGVPCAWGVGETTIELDCPCDVAHTFKFRFVKGLGLTADGDANWLLTTWPNAYLFAAIVEAGTLLGDADTVAGYEARLQPIVERIKIVDAQNVRQGTARVDPALLAGGGYNIVTDR